MTATVCPFMEVSVLPPTTPRKLCTPAILNPSRFSSLNGVDAPSKGLEKALYADTGNLYHVIPLMEM